MCVSGRKKERGQLTTGEISISYVCLCVRVCVCVCVCVFRIRPTLQSELAFEKMIFHKTQRSQPRGEPDVQLLDNSLLVFKFIADLQFYAVAGKSMNELVLASVLVGFTECTPSPSSRYSCGNDAHSVCMYILLLLLLSHQRERLTR